MKINIERDILLKPLQLVVSSVEKQQTMPILSNVLLRTDGQKLFITGTDLETESIATVLLNLQQDSKKMLSITVPGKKLLDICRALSEGANLIICYDEPKIVIKSGETRFVLATLPAVGFPDIDWQKEQQVALLKIKREELKDILESTHFAMAQQDSRYYLNGMLFEVSNGCLLAATSDGHRLALNNLISIDPTVDTRIMLPRKAVSELLRLLSCFSDQEIQICVGINHIRFIWPDFIFTSKLIDGKIPDFNRLVPRNNTKIAVLSTDVLKAALGRIDVISNEISHSIQLSFKVGSLQLYARNTECEEVEETVAIDYQCEPITINLNIRYLLDVFSSIKSSTVSIRLRDSVSGMIIEEVGGTRNNLYVVMPLCV